MRLLVKLALAALSPLAAAVPVAPNVIRRRVMSIVRRRDGSLWVATELEGVFRISGNRAERDLR